MNETLAVAKPLVYGQVVINTGRYYFRGAVVEIRGTQKPAECRNLGGIVYYGGGADIKIATDTGTYCDLPEAILRGGPPYVITNEIAGPAEIALLEAGIKAASAKRQADADAKAAARGKAREELPGLYPYLTRYASDSKVSGHALGAKNLRVELKRAFPGVKFSVTSSSFAGGDSISVRWTDGPTSDAVNTIADRYQEADFEPMDDSTSYRDNVFAELFGGAKYVSCSRNITDAVLELVARQRCEKHGVAYQGLSTRIDNDWAQTWACRILSKNAIPVGATVTGIELVDCEYRLTFANAAPAPVVGPGDSPAAGPVAALAA